MRDRAAMHSVRPLELIMEAGHVEETPPQRSRSSSWSSWRRNISAPRSRPRYSLQYQTDENSFLLRLKVIGAYTLAKKDIFGASDPYVRVELQTVDGDITIETFLTKTKKKTLNPVWNEEFIFRVKPSEHKLLIQVFDENRLTRDDFLGMVEVPLAGAPRESAGAPRPRPAKYPLKPRRSVARSRVRGHIEIYHAVVGRVGEAGAEGGEGAGQGAGQGAGPEGGAGEWELVEPPAQVGDVQPVLSGNRTVASFTGGGDWELLDSSDFTVGGEPLPAGWEERQDANGRTYYVNHVARSTQWERPTLMRNISSESHTERMENAATEFQRRFHISNDSNERAEVAPAALPAPAPAPAPASASAAAPATACEPAPAHQEDVTNRSESSSDGTQATPTPEPETDTEALPETPERSPEHDSSNCDSNLREDDDVVCANETDRRVETEIEEEIASQSVSEAVNEVVTADSQDEATDPISNEPSLAEDTQDNSEPNTDDPPTEPPAESSETVENTTENQEAENQDVENLNAENQDEENQETTDQVARDGESDENDDPPSMETAASQALEGSQALTFDENHFSTPTSGTPRPRRRRRTDSSDNTEDESDAPSSDSTRSSSASSAQSQNLPSSEGLPPGWSMQKAPNGRVFYIDHNAKTTTWIDPRTGSASTLPPVAAAAAAEADELGPLPEGWEERVHSDGRIFFIDHNTRSTQWEDPRLSNPQIAGPAVPYSRDYKRKYEYLKSNLRKPSNVPNKLEIKVRRSSILEDSYRIISSVSRLDLLKTKLWVEFESEVGLDYGGLAREWFFLLSKEMFNPYYGLFEYSAMDNYTLQINPNSGVCNEEHLNYFKFIGRVAGMAMYHGKLLDAFFIRPFYKMMLGKPIDLQDMESVDLEYYNSLMWIKENDPSELYLTFSVDEEQFGKTHQRDLKPGGANIPVDNDNKDEYIKLVIEWRFVSRVREQMYAFLEGAGALVPLHMLKIFDEHELELLLCGIQHVDVRDWRANTLYKGDYHANHVVVQWFWRVVLSFSNEMRSRLLQFVTGTSRVPMNGFKELYGSNGPQLFTIEKWGTPENYPRAHTCFNRIDLPPYESYQQLREKLVKAIEGSQGFAGVD